jgi:hypothetical protein
MDIVDAALLTMPRIISTHEPDMLGIINNIKLWWK